MRRTTVSLPDEIAIALEREATRRRSSASAIVREALLSYLHLSHGERRKLPFANLGASEYTDTARNMDKYLAEGWADAIEKDAFSHR